MQFINDWLLQHATIIRLSSFFTLLFVMASWELLAPKRTLTAAKFTRWFNNISLVILNTICVRLVLPMTAVSVAAGCSEQQWGVLNQLPFPLWLSVLLAIIALDFLIYLQHVVFHRVPLLWRLHRVHHADVDIDVTTGARFHPIEIILSMLIKFTAIVLLGTPAVAVLLFEVILNGMAMFNHSNIVLPARVDSLLRRFVVTPDMHRVHHSVLFEETNSNYGFNLSCWDRWCGTYRAQPAHGHLGMQIGLDRFREPHYLQLHHLLKIPFVSSAVTRKP